MNKPVKIFYSYSHLDLKYLERIKKNLAVLRRNSIIEDWGDRDINAGEEWKKAIDIKLEQADIVLLLISANFLASDYCYEYEMKRAMINHKLNISKVIPIILTDSDYRNAPFAILEVLPEKGYAIDDRNHWKNSNYAYANIVRGIRKVIENSAINEFLFVNNNTMVELLELTESKELKKYAVDRIKLKINELLHLDESYDYTHVYWFCITLAKIGGKSVKQIISDCLKSKHEIIKRGAKDAMEILENINYKEE